ALPHAGVGSATGPDRSACRSAGGAVSRLGGGRARRGVRVGPRARLEGPRAAGRALSRVAGAQQCPATNEPVQEALPERRTGADADRTSGGAARALGAR